MQRPLTALALRLLVATLPLFPATGGAQEAAPASVHWAYSAYFGTGWYSVSGDRDVFVVRMTPRWALSEPVLDADGNRSVGIYFKAPVSVGLDDFNYDDVLGAAEVDNVSFLSLNPGVDIEIPVNSIWSLRPYVSVGHGQALGSSESAWTYWAGVKSRLAFHSGKLNWRLINLLGFVGYTPSKGPSDAIWPAMAGLEFDYPVGQQRGDADQKLLHWHLAYTVIGDDLTFSGNPTVNRDITDQWEIGAAIGRENSPIRIWFMKFNRLGLGYRTSSDGNLKGIMFVFRSMFDE